MSIFDSPIDPQAIGWGDDGSLGGLIRTASVRGNVVMLPFSRTTTTISNAGTVTVAAISGGSNDLRNGAGSVLSISIPSNPSGGNGTLVRFPIQGNIFGLRYQNTAGVSFGCKVDGVPYDVPLPLVNPLTQISTNIFEGVIADNLGDGQHIVELEFSCSLTTNRAWSVYGYLVDEQSNKAATPGGKIGLNAIALTTSYLTICGSGQQLNGNAMRGVWLVNVTGSPVAVTIKNNGTSVVFFNGPVPANDTRFVDFGIPLYDCTEFQALAASGSAITAIPVMVP